MGVGAVSIPNNSIVNATLYGGGGGGGYSSSGSDTPGNDGAHGVVIVREHY
jgi:hypothetical protein